MRERGDALVGLFYTWSRASRLLRPSEEAGIDACDRVRWVRAGRLDMHI